MPAVSKDQQRAAGLALKAKKDGKVDDLRSGAAKEMAKSMSEKELEKFASTKHKGLPEKKKDEARSYAGASLAEVLEEYSVNEEMLGVEEGDEITTQKSKDERVEEKGSKKKSTKDSWTSAVNSVASHSRHPLSTNTSGARVAEAINPERWQILAGILKEQVSDDDYEGPMWTHRPGQDEEDERDFLPNRYDWERDEEEEEAMEEAMLGGVSNSAPNPGHRAKMNECGDEEEQEEEEEENDLALIFSDY
jgi:hypothetical protein